MPCSDLGQTTGPRRRLSCFLGRFGAGLALFLAAWLVGPPGGIAQSQAATCGYGTGGPSASSLCWFDLTEYNDAAARGTARDRGERLGLAVGRERWSHDRGSVSASVPAASLRVSATRSTIWSCVPTVICDGATRR